jgi:hypothetical protein
MYLSPVLYSVSGHSQSDTSGGSNNNPIVVHTAKINYSPLDKFAVSGGILNPTDNHSTLLMEERGLPGLRIQYGIPEQKGFQFLGYAESDIVTSQSLTTNTRDKEATPTLQSLGIGIRSNSNTLTVSLLGSAYSFKDLPNSIATESGLFGNSVRSINSTESQFIYEYSGFEAIFELKYQFTNRFTPAVRAVYITNENAPSGLKNGYLIHSEVEAAVSSKFSIIPIYEYFRIEPDAVVSSLSNSRLDSNRVGYHYVLMAEFSHQFRIFAGAGERDTIYSSPTQSRETLYELGMETLNAPF